MTKQKEIEEMVDMMTASNNPFIDIPTEQMTKVAEAIYNAGYRKVLLDTENGYAVDVIQYAPWQLIKGYTEREVERTRKEMAKEFAEKLKEKLFSVFGKTLCSEFDTEDITLFIDELLKEYEK